MIGQRWMCAPVFCCLRVGISLFQVAIARKFAFVVAGELESLLAVVGKILVARELECLLGEFAWRVCSCWKVFLVAGEFECT